jgi:hypothetical protein
MIKCSTRTAPKRSATSDGTGDFTGIEDAGRDGTSSGPLGSTVGDGGRVTDVSPIEHDPFFGLPIVEAAEGNDNG